MSRNLPSLVFATLVAGGMARAEVPSVAADIAPVHALVARVMDGIGAPDLIVPPGATPHGHTLRPSEARALQQADIVVWIGPDLTPWLANSIATLAADATAIALLVTPEARILDLRDGALFEATEDGHGPGDDDGASMRETEGAHAGDDEADHGGRDPHAWLDPGNARVWLDVIAAEISKADPENVDSYLANAAAGKAELDELVREIDDILEPVRDRDFIVFHDAYQYFESAFDMPATGTIAFGDAARPGPARVDAIRARVSEANVTCVLAEPQFNRDLVETVLDGTRARAATLDPLGSDLSPGAQLYPDLLRGLARALAGCL